VITRLLTLSAPGADGSGAPWGAPEGVAIAAPQTPISVPA
jgi:hypothetical protein